MNTSSRMLGKTLADIESLVDEQGLPTYRANQVAQWLYKRHAGSWAEMTNLPASLRRKMESRQPVGREAPLDVSESEDGTKKYLFPAGDAMVVESALIPDGDRRTLCVSTQAGCRRGCRFCFTARGGFQGNIDAGAIINQYASCPECDSIKNIVFMGMGEPFDNTDAVLKAVDIFTADYAYAMSPTRLTVSTVGVIPGMKRYLDKKKAHLAVSLNSPFSEQRAELMPSEREYPIKDIVRLLRKYDWSGQRRLTFEYIMFAGLNDSPAHADAVARMLRGLECRVNLIPFNAAPGIGMQASSREAIEHFQQRLKKGGILTTIRKSKGADIEAACGQLSASKRILPTHGP